MSTPTAIVTGGSSGIGLALTQHLLSKNWHVAILDLQPPLKPLPTSSVLFIKTNVASWDSTAAAFSQVHAWSSRLDFVALNAGIDDRDDIFSSIDSTTPPRKPNMLTFEVDLFAPYYGVKLAAHYMARNKVKGGKVVMTSSAAGLRGAPFCPQYCAAKHGIVGLARALGPVAATTGVTVNAVCPAFVETGLAPPGLRDAFRDDQITPMSTMMRAFDELCEFERVGEGERWTGGGKNGAVVEVSLGNLYWREELEGADIGMDDPNDKSTEAWGKIYRERNTKFASEDWEKKVE
ncbi:short-chain dehydrogenase-like protein 22 [Elsinoe australis]|uniref:Short-chain dehydrogenase-like protein 22 n=1 Tax=Elsinoe australis TaxID=40998 RepID=A0A4U7APU3_9PEZI|nr:short-chain dehydrogenase-like protein 22 [Elsinoe australis]